jgi:5-formaminoimidazole-4-carboxamide-1-beta-D-ribofuranosyl 5'-monophosphate synthetase
MPKLFVQYGEYVFCEGSVSAIRQGSLLSTNFRIREISKTARDYLYKESLLNKICLNCERAKTSKKHFVEVSEHAFAGPFCLQCCVKKINTMAPEHGQIPDIPVYIVSVSAISKDKTYKYSPAEPEDHESVDLRVQLF